MKSLRFSQLIGSHDQGTIDRHGSIVEGSSSQVFGALGLRILDFRSLICSIPICPNLISSVGSKAFIETYHLVVSK